MRLVLYLIFICLPFSISAQTYVERFQQYWEWNEHFPPIVTTDFLNFIQEPKPLSIKLRNRYLYYLARQKDWTQLVNIYKPTADISLECLNLTAQVHLNSGTNIMPRASQLWETGQPLPTSCNEMSTWLSKKQEVFQTLIKKRLPLVLEKNNVNLARYLIKRSENGGQKEADLLSKIAQNPKIIGNVGSTNNWLSSQLYLFGLKRLISLNMPLAIQYFQSAHAQKLLSAAQKQFFLQMLVTYQAIRNDKATLIWFKQINPQYYTSELLEWQIRYAIRNHDWKHVITIAKLPQLDKDHCWIYWQARAFEALGNMGKAKQLYLSIANLRSYYGFLASIKLKTKFQFQDEVASPNTRLLSAYQPILNQIRTAFLHNHKLDASRMLSDFSLELTKPEKRALIYWVMYSLKWPAKAILMSNEPNMMNLLALRFPLTHKPLIKTHAQNYHIPPELIFAVIRQESGFREEVVSSAGAHGLMQLMPTTAKKIAQAKKIPYRQAKELFISQKNIQLGAAYLHTLASVFQSHPVLMAAAYNAGPRQTRLWQKANPSQPIDIWIETIPWRETRNYIKNVIAFYLVYQYRMKQTPDLTPLMRRI